MKFSRHNKLILFLRTGYFVTNRRTYEGIYDFCRDRKWMIRTVEASNINEGNGNRGKIKTLEWLKELITFWNPDGCIVMGDVVDPLRDSENFSNIPTVYCDALPELVSEGANLISVDSSAIAECAARELLTSGLDSFAYVSYPNEYAWCEERKKCFHGIIEMNGKKFSSARLPNNHCKSDTVKFRRWLNALPKPVGVLAANDKVAEEIVIISQRCGFSIPRDIVLLGVDNDEHRCENSSVSISSIEPEFRKAGFLAGELLEKVMVSRQEGQLVKFGVNGIVKRASSWVMNKFDKQVIQGVEYIRRHACEGIGVEDVVKAMECSRRYADMKFSEILGWSILHEIRKTKVQEVKKLLCTTNSHFSAIADMCGFNSCDDMRRTFRQFEGLSLSDWRRMEKEGEKNK